MPGTEDYFVSRPKKAQRACQLCSATKVRCIAEAGSPCHNCVRRGWKCETDQRIRRKRRVYPKISGFIPKSPSQNWSWVGMGAFAPPSIPTPQSLPTNDGFYSPTGIPEPEYQKDAFSPLPLQPWAVHELTPPESPEEELWNAFTHLSSEQRSSCEEYSTESLLPGFIKPLPSSMNPATIDYLLSNGALSLPSLPLQNALLQAFAECVLPTMPIIEWQTFLNAVNHQESGHSSVSLLLFHAVMFSATTFVGTEHLFKAGFSNRREAQDAFFQKVQLLYQTNYEADPITAVQTLLLMTYRVDTADGHDSRHWIKVAISMASSVGMFQDLFTPTSLPCSPRLWKRIAWTCYMMDSQIALRLRYRPTIQRAGFSHNMLTEDDFDFAVSNPDGTAPSPCVLPSLEKQRDLANICIANARLCLSINEMLQFRGKDDPPLYTSGTPSSSGSTISDESDHAARVSTCEMELAAWANSLPHSCHASSLEMNRFDDDPVVVVQRSLLHMVFYTAVAILHQVQPFPSSKFCVKHAAHQITVIASELRRRNLHSRLSIVGVTATLVALIIHISELKEQSSEAEESVDHCRLCVDVIADLRDVYWEADSVTNWALETFEKIGIGARASWITIDDVQDDWIEINA